MYHWKHYSQSAVASNLNVVGKVTVSFLIHNFHIYIIIILHNIHYTQ